MWWAQSSNLESGSWFTGNLAATYSLTNFLKLFTIHDHDNTMNHNFCSGDQDSVVPLTGTRTLVNGLAKDLGLNTTVPYRNWFQGRQVDIHKI